MNINELKQAMRDNEVDAFWVDRIGKTPMSKKQLDSLKIEVDGKLRDWSLFGIVEDLRYALDGHTFVLHLDGLTCSIEPDEMWEAFSDRAGRIERSVRRAEGDL